MAKRQVQMPDGHRSTSGPAADLCARCEKCMRANVLGHCGGGNDSKAQFTASLVSLGWYAPRDRPPTVGCRGISLMYALKDVRFRSAGHVKSARTLEQSILEGLLKEQRDSITPCTYLNFEPVSW